MKFLYGEAKDIKVFPVFEDKLDNDTLTKLAQKKLFEGKSGNFFSLLDVEGKGEVYWGLGKSEELKTNKLIESFYKLAKELKSKQLLEVEIILPTTIKENNTFTLKAIEGLLQEEYKWEDYKTEKSDECELNVALEVSEELQKEIKNLENIIGGVFVTRTLVNIPSNDLYPETYANKIVELFKDTKVDVEILDKAQCEELGMEAMLQVGRGSAKEPKFIIMRYLPISDTKEHLTFVGKGLTYDSGGYAIKPATGMVTMKCDMGGSASVVGALYALAKNDVKKNVVAVVAAVENMISGDAYKNGDIIGSMKGTTIEIGNTDAEGRLTLADAIYYAATKLESKAIVDLATLTGACIVALGEKVTGMVSNNDELANLMLECSESSDENLHRFSVFETHRDQIKGKFGDLKNSTTGGAGSITAGIFLEHFAENKPWVHLDIAGPAYFDNAWSYYPAGGSGIPVKTIYEFACNF